MRSRFASLDAKQVVSKGIKEPWPPVPSSVNGMRLKNVLWASLMVCGSPYRMPSNRRSSRVLLPWRRSSPNRTQPFGVQLQSRTSHGESGSRTVKADVPQAPLVERLTHLAKKTEWKRSQVRSWEEGDEDKGYKSAKGEVRDHFAVEGWRR